MATRSAQLTALEIIDMRMSKIMDEFKVLARQRNCFSPFLCLPNELMDDILLLAFGSLTSQASRRKLALAFMSTSQALRRIVLHLPLRVEIGDLTPRSLIWPDYCLQVVTSTRCFDFQWAVDEGAIRVPSCARLPGDNNIGWGFLNAVSSSGLGGWPRFNTSDDTAQASKLLQSIRTQISKRQSRLRTVDIIGDIDDFPEWWNIVEGDSCNLQTIRVFAKLSVIRPQPLGLTSTILTTLILRSCVPPRSNFPKLRILVVHNLSATQWPKNDVEVFLRGTPQLQRLSFQGSFFQAWEGATSVQVHLPHLESMTFWQGGRGAAPLRLLPFLAHLNVRVERLTIDIVDVHGWHREDMIDLTSLPHSLLDRLVNVVVSSHDKRAEDAPDTDDLVRLRNGTITVEPRHRLLSPVNSTSPLLPTTLYITQAKHLVAAGTKRLFDIFPMISSIHVPIIYEDHFLYPVYKEALERWALAGKTFFLYDHDNRAFDDFQQTTLVLHSMSIPL